MFIIHYSDQQLLPFGCFFLAQSLLQELFLIAMDDSDWAVHDFNLVARMLNGVCLLILIKFALLFSDAR